LLIVRADIKYLIEPATASDEPFLWEMLYQAIYVPAGAVAPARQIVDTPELSRYVRGWGLADDYGLKALATDGRQPVGAAWLRLLTGENKGYGYVDDLTPELSIAVVPERRGEGIGTLLLKSLLEGVRGRYGAVSLSVSRENPALRLYERQGFEVIKREGESLIMRKRLA
jgi:ribosomal protein S18 acetylase RimI-like enzyme